jgi:hypothetical protein
MGETRGRSYMRAMEPKIRSNTRGDLSFCQMDALRGVMTELEAEIYAGGIAALRKRAAPRRRGSRNRNDSPTNDTDPSCQ